jgi:hypothetical protein
LKLLGIQQRKYPPEGIMRGNTSRQFQKLLQPPLTAAPKQLHINPALRPTDHRTDRYRNHVQQLMFHHALLAGVMQFTKMLTNRGLDFTGGLG